MPLGFGSVGAGSTGNGTGSLAPTAPASIAVGDTLILVLAQGTLGSTGGSVTPSNPAGWTLLGSGVTQTTGTGTGTQITVWGRIATGTDPMPTSTWTTLVKWSAQCYRYTGVAGSGLPTASFGPGQNGVSSANNPCTIVATAANQWVSYIYSSRTTTITSYSAITGLTVRGNEFGSGGGAVDVFLLDTNGSISGTVPNRTAVGNASASYGENAILLWPVEHIVATRATSWNTYAPLGLVKNDFEQVPLGSSPTPANSGGGSDSAFSFNDYTASNGVASSSGPAHGSRCLVVNASSTSSACSGWTFIGAWQLAARLYVKLPSAPTAIGQVLQVANKIPMQVAAIGFDTDHFTVLDNYTANAHSFGSFAAHYGQWLRCDLSITVSQAGLSTIAVAWTAAYNGEYTVPVESWSSSTFWAGNDLIHQIAFGKIYATAYAASGNLAVDSIAMNDSSATLLTPYAPVAPVAASTRATTWEVFPYLVTVAASRATNWVAAASITAPRVTTWVTSKQLSSTRATTWTVATPVPSSVRATTWIVATPVGVATRATTWTTAKQAATARATTWTVCTPVAVSRLTRWNSYVATATTRVTSWAVLTGSAAQRATSWVTRAVASSSRATSWGALKSIAPARLTTWQVAGPITASRNTSWNVAGVLATVAATRATSWDTASSLLLARQSTWDVCTSTVLTVATAWDALITTPATRPTSWSCAQQVPTTRATNWNALATVSTGQSTSWSVEVSVAASSRSTNWDTTVLLSLARMTTWETRATAAASSISPLWDVLSLASSIRAASWSIAVPSGGVSRATTWIDHQSVTETRTTSWISRWSYMTHAASDDARGLLAIRHGQDRDDARGLLACSGVAPR